MYSQFKNHTDAFTSVGQSVTNFFIGSINKKIYYMPINPNSWKGDGQTASLYRKTTMDGELRPSWPLCHTERHGRKQQNGEFSHDRHE